MGGYRQTITKEISEIHMCYNFILFYFILFFWLRHMACKILVPGPGIEPGPTAVKALSPDHWTTREFPTILNRVVGKFSLRSDISSKAQKRQGREAPG